MDIDNGTESGMQVLQEHKAAIKEEVEAIRGANRVRLFVLTLLHIGSAPGEDADTEGLREDLLDLVREACYAYGIHCAEVGL